MTLATNLESEEILYARRHSFETTALTVMGAQFSRSRLFPSLNPMT